MPEREELMNIKAKIGIDRARGKIKMEFPSPVGDYLVFTPEEAERLGVILIGRAAILEGIINEKASQKVPVEKL